MEFAYAGGGLGKGGTVSLFVDGKKVGEGKVGAMEPIMFSADDGCEVGIDTGRGFAPIAERFSAHEVSKANNSRVQQDPTAGLWSTRLGRLAPPQTDVTTPD
jgi:hypothetical protein